MDLPLRSRTHEIKSVVFRSSEKFFSGDPDFDWMQAIRTRRRCTHPKRDPDKPKKGNPRRARTLRMPAPTTRPNEVVAACGDSFLFRGLGHVALHLRVDAQVVERPGDHGQHGVAWSSCS